VLAVLVLSRNRWTAFAHALTAGGGAAVAILVAREHEEIAEATGGSGAGAVVSTLIVAGLACAVVALFTRSLAVDRLRLPPHTARRFVPGVVALVLVSLLLVGRGPIGEAWHDFRHDEEVSAGPDPASRLTTAGGNRNDLWSSALDAFDAHPLNGIGPGTYEFFWLQDARDPEYVRDAHSLYLEQMAELGLPGLLLVLGLLGGLLAAALKARGSLESPGDLAASVALTSAFVVFTVNAGVDWMWEETAVGALALGGIAIAAAGGAGRQRRRRRRGPIWRPGVRTGIVALAIVAAAFEVPGLVATQRVRSSEDAARDGDLEGAGELVKDAIDAQPWAATPHVQLALVLEQQGDLDAARSEIREAISKERASWEWPLIEARIESELGNRQGARRTFTKGRRLWPLSPFYSPFSELGQDVYTRRQLLRLAGQPIGK
jgi:tetratricopeptide (TPR) repeat protein